MKTLKTLTKEECIKIASIVKPDVKWKFVDESPIKWDGFDLVSSEEQPKFIFQIDYRNFSTERNPPNRFRLYEDLEEIYIDQFKIDQYLVSINCFTAF